MNDQLDIRKMGYAFAHNLPQMQLCDKFGMFTRNTNEFLRRYVTVDEIESPRDLRNQAEVERMGLSGRIGAEETAQKTIFGSKDGIVA